MFVRLPVGAVTSEREESMVSLSKPIELLRPPMLHFGEGVVAGLAGWVTQRGFAKPFVIADTANAGRLATLGLGEVGLFGGVAGEPDIGMLDRAVAAARGADLIIGFGGGSAMDLAKLVAVMISYDLKLADISGPHRAPRRKVGLAQVPTTAGTGSEVGTRALITDHEKHTKVATESREMLADVTFIDPLLTVSVPPAVTAATGLDALAHCVEAYTSKRSHPLVDAYAVQGIELVGKYLKRAVVHGADIEARAGLALAAFYGGICLGPVNTTAGHAVSYPIGTRFGLPHGLANALIFPHTLAVNARAAPEKTAVIAAALGFAGKDVALGGQRFCADLGLDMQLRAYKIPKDALKTMAGEAHAIRRLLDWNPVDLKEADIEALYERAW